MNTKRIIDANINRVSEGLRVLEDILRFSVSSDNSDLTYDLKTMRHSIRKSLKDYCVISERDSINDSGFKSSQETEIDRKSTSLDLIKANFKRVQEGLRVLEEMFNLLSERTLSKNFEKMRFKSYNLEKTITFNNKKFKTISDIKSDLYCLTDEKLSCGRNNIEVVRELINSGIKVIQYREKDKYTLYKYEECKEIRKLTRDNNVTFIVNDDVALAVAVEADGIHIGQEDLPIKEVRKIVGDNMVIGLSTHSESQAKKAVENGADYIGAGPVYETDTKKDVCEPVGLSYIKFVNENIKIPFVAIGGIKEHNIKEVKECGADTFALVSEIVGAENIKDKIENLRKIIK